MLPVLFDGQRVIPSSVIALSGLPRVGRFQLAIRLLISNEFILDPTSPHLHSSLAQQFVMQPEGKLLLIPEFPSSVLALKTSCPSLFPASAVSGFSIPGGRKVTLEMLHFPPTTHRPGAEGCRAKGDSFFIDYGQNELSRTAFCITWTKGLTCICSYLNYCFSLSKTAKSN